MKNWFVKTLSLTLSIILMGSQLTTHSNAFEIENIEGNTDLSQSFVSGETELQEIFTESKQPDIQSLSTHIEAHMVPASDHIQVVFESADVKECTYTANGLTVLQPDLNSLGFQLFPQREFSAFELTVTHNDEQTSCDTIYVYKRNDMSFISDLSMDDAFINGLQYSYEQGYISQAEKDIEYAKYTQQYFDVTDIEPVTIPSQKELTLATNNTTVSISAEAKIIVHGYLEFRPQEGATTLLPLRHVEVQLVDCSTLYSVMVDKTYTDENGYYYMECDAPDGGYEANSLSIRFSASAESFYVDGYTQRYYDYRIPKSLTAGEENYGTLFLTYNEESLLFRYMYLHQIMAIGQRYAVYAGATWNNQRLRVFYPSNTFDVSGCFYGYALIREDDFNQPDTLIHEYGHFVQQSQGFGLSHEDIESFPTHGMDEDQLHAGKPKNYATKLVWTESWATVFSMIAQDRYHGEYSGMEFWTIYSHLGSDCENISTNPAILQHYGEFQELAVTSFLWDLYDDGINSGVSGVSESHDTIALGAQRWWQYTTHEGTITLTDFMEDVKTYYDYNIDKIGAIMSAYQISPTLSVNNATSVTKNAPPQLSWTVNGSINNPNDRFDIVFYDEFDDEIYSITGIDGSGYAYNEKFNYTVPYSTWNKIVGPYAGTFSINIIVYSYHTEESPESGPYPSNQVSLDFNGMRQNISVYSSTRYIEKPIKLKPEQYCEFAVTFATSGTKLIQTFGETDTILELYSSDGTYITSNDDGGYSLNSLLSCTVTEGETYIIRLSFYAEEEATYGYNSTKLAITPAKSLIASGKTAITKYEDIYNIAGTSYEFSEYIDQDYTTVFRFTPSADGDYTFEIESDYDTYLYVIDPTSAEVIVIDVNYNDEGGDASNAMLTTSLLANRQYFVIVSDYNPSSIEDAESFHLSIAQN